MSDHSIKSKQFLIQQLREVAEKETAWLEKNRLLYTQKRERLDNLIRERGQNGGEVSAEEQKLSKHVTLYESKRAGMRDIASGINREEKNLAAMKARRKKKKEPLTEKEIVKFAEELGYDLEPIESSKSKRSSKPEVRSDSVVEMWRDKNEADVASARHKQASAKRRLAGQLNSFSRCPYCEQKLTFERSHVDHIHPVSKGGLSEDDNLVLVCAPCNTAKSNKTLRAFCRDVDLTYDVVVARLEMIGKAV
ncbi:HNH endonuclease [Litorivicinus sp.]|nr:HNH endonuclease [Litorivicinus sp.]